jgi:hypothetical protein
MPTTRKALIRLAASLPVGSPERKVILTGIQKSAGNTRSARVHNWGAGWVVKFQEEAAK